MRLKRELAELWQYRELVEILVRRDLTVRYKNTKLGFLWSLLNPLIQVIVITVVLEHILGVDIRNYSAYVFCAVLPWSFFQLSLLDASDSLVKHYALIKKVYFPREVIPLATVLANLLHFVLATGVFLVYMTLLPLFWWVVSGDQPVWALQPTLLLAPLVMAMLFFLVMGLAFFAAATNVFFHDVRYLVSAGLSILYYAVPVLYFSEMVKGSPKVPAGVYTLYMLNPLAALITGFRKLILVPTASDRFHELNTSLNGESLTFLGVAIVTSLLVAVVGYAFFNRRKPKFAERP